LNPGRTGESAPVDEQPVVGEAVKGKSVAVLIVDARSVYLTVLFFTSLLGLRAMLGADSMALS